MYFRDIKLESVWLWFVKTDKASCIYSQIQWKMKLIANSPFFTHWSNLFYLQTPCELRLNDKMCNMLILHLFLI